MVAVIAIACGPRHDPHQNELVVLAAASLESAFRALGETYASEHSRTRILFSFAGTQSLASQLRAGVGADIIATANVQIMRGLNREGLTHEPRAFATNRLVWIISQEAFADGLSDPEGLRGSERTVVLAAPEVPAGHYARQALTRLGLLDTVEARLVSLELDVKGVLAKVRLAGADVGIVYATDVLSPARGDLHVIEFQDDAELRPTYWIAPTRDSQNPAEATAFASFVRSDAARRILRAHGFGLP